MQLLRLGTSSSELEPSRSNLNPQPTTYSPTPVSLQVLSVNGQAALSNIQAVQMLREAVGEVILAVRDTPLTRTPRGTPINPNLSSGLRPINIQ